MSPPLIRPTIGRVVLVFNRPGNLRPLSPEAALIAYVHNDSLINVGGFSHEGSTFNLTSLPLDNGDGKQFAAGVTHAEWMPYQKGQAAKTEALESQLSRPAV